MRRYFFGLILLFSFLPTTAYSGESLTKLAALTNAGLLFVDGQGQSIYSDDAEIPLIPASTTKLATAYLALKHWREEHRFNTQFYFDETSQTLWIKGSGDPYLVSEELELIAKNLKQLGLNKVEKIGLDTSLFEAGLNLPGAGTSNNPYDAPPSALAANFNTVNIKKSKGKVFSAEPQTPLTAYAVGLAENLQHGELRVNTGPNPQNAEKYFAELLAAFLRLQSIETGDQIIFGTIPTLPVYYTHANSKPLGEIVRAMLKYSTNFVANQLILMLSSEAFQRPANTADVQAYLQQTLTAQFHWEHFTLQDGAGLSRENRLSPKQLVELLHAFQPWKYLLPEIEPNVYAKSGTLNGVSTLAGYIVSNGEWLPFALMMNVNTPYRFRNQIARELVQR